MTQAYVYGPVIATAQRLIKRFGGPVTIVATNDTPAVEGWKPPIRVTTGDDVIGVFTKYEQKFINGTTIQEGDQKCIFSALGLTYPANMTGFIERTLPDGTVEKWSIVKLSPLNPGGTVIIYTAQVRQ